MFYLLSELQDLIKPNDLDRKAKPMKLKNFNDKRNAHIGAGRKVTAQTVVIKDTATGVVIGRRSLFQKL